MAALQQTKPYGRKYKENLETVKLRCSKEQQSMSVDDLRRYNNRIHMKNTIKSTMASPQVWPARDVAYHHHVRVSAIHAESDESEIRSSQSHRNYCRADVQVPWENLRCFLF
ncbi:hypothetical protein AMELA_G00256200 [Ameiurus melas]|uniref:Uncharacterized protein n=1 Tax=Ameiurus melas TaxID=219545 RepID=A0A7J5ZRD9_AMEME|nr:hypothetical protein AMELA_G00256200 [Ameiurus melas]